MKEKREEKGKQCPTHFWRKEARQTCTNKEESKQKHKKSWGKGENSFEAAHAKNRRK